MDRGACWATVHGVTKSETWLKQLSTHAHAHTIHFTVQENPTHYKATVTEN